MTINEAMVKIKAAILEIYSSDVIDIRLEEVEGDNEDWNITVSFLTPNMNPSNGLAAALIVSGTQDYNRLYKIITINKLSGEIKSIKIYKNE